MRAHFRVIDLSDAGVGNSEVLHVGQYLHKTIQIDGTFVASLEVQISLNGDDYHTVGSAITASGIVSVDEACQYLRIRTASYTSGTPEAWFGGLDARTDV